MHWRSDGDRTDGMNFEQVGAQLLNAFAAVPDAGLLQGRRHTLAATLALSTAAMLAGARSLYAIARWGRGQGPEVLRAMGFTHPKTPTVSTLHLIFKHLEVPAYEAALQT